MSDSGRIYAALEARFAAPEWAFLREVTNSTGFGKRRSADAVALNLWPSRGMEINGVEVKASRGDWLRELKQPEKSAPVQKFCHRWWIATLPGVVVDGELPSTWGLLLLQKRGLVAKVQAPLLEAQPPDVGFVASLGRRMNESVASAKRLAADELRTELRVDEEYERGRLAGRAEVGRDLPRLQASFDQWRASVNAFEEASGLSIHAYNGPQLGEIVGRIMRTSRGDRAVELGSHIDALRRTIDGLSDEQKALVAFLAEEAPNA